MSKRGRKKIIITDAEIKQIEGYAARGLSHEEIYYALGIGKDAFYINKKENPEITEALKRGKSKGHLEISNKLFDSAKKGNTVAQIFYLKCRAGWKETNAIELAGKDGQAIEHAHGLTSPARRFMDRLSEHAKKLGAKRIDKGDTES